jgi:hypothetical protein
MEQLPRRTFIRGLGAAVALGPAALRSSAAMARGAHPHLTRIDAQSMIGAQQAHAWHVAKDSRGGPTPAGSPSWKHFLEFTERELRARGVVDIIRNAWTYQRWFTTEWPHDENWTLHLDGQKVRVASYGAYSGMTDTNGVTAPLIAYRPGMSPQRVRGKIVVVPAGVDGPDGNEFTAVLKRAQGADYETLSDAETFTDPLAPRAAGRRLSPFGKLSVDSFVPFLREGGAAGMLFLVDLSYDVLAGVSNFRVPARYDTPTLFLDRQAAPQVTAAAGAGSSATLRLIAHTEQAETYQLLGYLPGRNYGTPDDEQIMLVTHTDGPSISQDNGALGILGMVHYFSKIPRAERPRTLMIFLDTRHFMPGAEAAFAEQDYAARHPKIHKPVVAAIGIEHLGQMEYVEQPPGKPFQPNGLEELSTVWVSNNQRLVDLAIGAVRDNHLKRVQVQCPGRPGSHGGPQGPWFGLGRIANRLGVPGAATMGSMTAYWSTRARIDALDADHFVAQVATMSQSAGALMVADMRALAAAETRRS